MTKKAGKKGRNRRGVSGHPAKAESLKSKVGDHLKNAPGALSLVANIIKIVTFLISLFKD